jgi:hypothetical protein
MYQDGMELMLTLALFLWSLDSSTKKSLSVSLLLSMTTLGNNISENYQLERFQNPFMRHCSMNNWQKY